MVTAMLRYLQTDRQAEKGTDNKTDRQIEGKKDREIDKQVGQKKVICTYAE